MARRAVQALARSIPAGGDDAEATGIRGASTEAPGASPSVQVFGAGGLLSQKFQAYEPRPGQVAMAEAVERALATNQKLLVEAPTGVGKSLAYLAPAIAAGKRVLVVTANIALQEQLVKKDLPLLAQILPKPFRFALAKGINNYACRVTIDEAERKGVRRKLPVFDRAQWDELVEWSEQTSAGDLSELSFEPTPAVRQWAATTSDDCPGADCRSASNCFVQAARALWHTADVLVTNYHLFFVDLTIRAKGAPGVLPDYDAVVFDEAHKAADIARDFFGFRITERAVANLAKAIADPLAQDKLEKSAGRLFLELRRHRDSDRYKARIKVQNVAPEAANTCALLAEAGGKLDHQARASSDNETRHKLRQRAQRCRDLREQLEAASKLSETSVFFIGGDKERVTLESKLIDVAEPLARELFSKSIPIVLTSATLATDGSDFSFVRRELGVAEARELVVESPFDFSNATVVLPRMPIPTDRDYARAVAVAVERSILAAGGRTLALFTSWRVLNAAHEHLMRCGLPFQILKQGDAPRTELVRRFKEDVSSVLLGTESFWAGVDVPGEALSCVVIDRLPFTSPDDPVLDAITERDPRGWFFGYSLPRAIVQLKQGFGRLIRSSSDRGVVVLLDNRVSTKPYGSKFLRALPVGVGFSDQFEAIAETLE